MVGGMEHTPDEQPERLSDDVFGAPRKFSYPEPIPCSEEDQRYYDEINARIVERLKSQKGRRSRWRPVD